MPVAIVLLIGLATPARAAVTYDFIEAGSTTVGATLTFKSPPASSSQAWGTSSASDIIDFRLLDASIGTVGSYLPTIFSRIASGDGTTLDSGIIEGLLASDNSTSLTADLAGGGGASLLIGDDGELSGSWVLEVAPPSVPEPSSMAMCGIAGLVGLAFARLRRKQA